MKIEHIVKLLTLKKEWKQSDLIKFSDSSKAHVSKTIKKLEEQNIVTKTDRSVIIVIDLPKLLNYWVSLRKLPKPFYLDAKEDVEKIEQKLKKSDIEYSISFFRAAWHRLKLLKVEKIEIYVLEKDLSKIFRLIGRSKPFGKIEVYPAAKFEIFGYERVSGLRLVPLAQNYVDLMLAGGNGTRIALELAKKYELFGV
jgi:DNA-binding MarR family transcriptional regulator